MGFSLNTYTLLATDIHNAGRREASIKYFYLSAVSAGLLIYGIFLVYSIAGTLDYTALNNFFTNSNALNTEYELTTAISGICLILTGLSFKLSAFPGHLWAPEVYEGASNPTAAFFILPAKVGAVLFLFNLVTGPLASAHNVCSTALLIFGVVSVVWGCLAATYEKKIKRFLAYTSINQVGFLLLALVSGTFDSTLLLLFYLATYAAGGAGFMAIFLTARRARGLLNVYLTDFRGYAVTNLLAAIYAAAFLFSMAGMPPFGGFFAKYFLFVELQFAQAYVAVVVGLITSLPSAYYYLRVIKLMLFEVDANLEVPHAPLTRVSYRLMYWPLLFLGAAVVLSPALFDLFASVITNAAGEI
jgi:NADH-quinone oxidoreductase subunit N